MKKACVIGHPIAHSRSPLIHNHWLKQHGIEGHYEKRDVAPENLAAFFRNFREEGYVGCNVTIPHKETAVDMIAHVDNIVRKLGSLNTVYLRPDGLHATSTDGEGFYQNLISEVPQINLKGEKVIVLGAGGSAKAVIERLLRAGAQIVVLNRTRARADALAAQFGPSVKPITQDHFVAESKLSALLINTTSQGMTGQPALPIDLSALPKTAVVSDLVYVPLKTQLLKDAEMRGLRTVGGLGMLLHQAVEGFEKWFGVRPIVTRELYELVAADVEKGAR